MDGRRPDDREVPGAQNPAYSPTRLPPPFRPRSAGVLLVTRTRGVESGSNRAARPFHGPNCPRAPGGCLNYASDAGTWRTRRAKPGRPGAFGLVAVLVQGLPVLV